MTQIVDRRRLPTTFRIYNALWLIYETPEHYCVVMESKEGNIGSAVHAVSKTDYMKEGDDLV
jgi:hypothetical protein